MRNKAKKIFSNYCQTFAILAMEKGFVTSADIRNAFRQQTLQPNRRPFYLTIPYILHQNNLLNVAQVDEVFRSMYCESTSTYRKLDLRDMPRPLVADLFHCLDLPDQRLAG